MTYPKTTSFGLSKTYMFEKRNIENEKPTRCRALGLRMSSGEDALEKVMRMWVVEEGEKTVARSIQRSTSTTPSLRRRHGRCLQL